MLHDLSRGASTAALALLAVVDVGLIAVALEPAEASTPEVALRAADTRTASPSVSVGANASSTSPTAAEPLRRLVVGVDEAHAWVVRVGSCADAAASVTMTADAGQTWSEPTELSHGVTRLRPSAASTAFVVAGTRAACTPKLRTTTDGGATWSDGGSATATWYRDPAKPQVVHVPDAGSARPCDDRAVADLAVGTTGHASVLCADGTVLSTVDTAATWQDRGRLSGALAITTDSGNRTVAARVGAPSCAGLQIMRIGRRRPLGCIEMGPGDIEPGQVAISAAGSVGWLTAGQQVWRSIDGLERWTPTASTMS